MIQHEPKHIHVMKGGNFAKIELSGLRVSKNYLRPGELRKAIVIVRKHREESERRWDEYFQR
ncbi:MAG: hypothetical protein B6245_16135 [Desulfobacteraceae bacterium 4572_88]|nr:MAG: hypothetical protein B6245_16135 [Desulfobacteraceae bacterium 4572_88]